MPGVFDKLRNIGNIGGRSKKRVCDEIKLVDKGLKIIFLKPKTRKLELKFLDSRVYQILILISKTMPSVNYVLFANLRLTHISFSSNFSRFWAVKLMVYR